MFDGGRRSSDRRGFSEVNCTDHIEVVIALNIRIYEWTLIRRNGSD